MVKTATGITTPNSIVTYNVNIINTGDGNALAVILTNQLGSFLDMELVESGGSWTALHSLTVPYTLATESFDSGNNLFDYDPVSFCGAATPANSPCYDPSIEQWQIQLNEPIPPAGSLDQKYRARIE